MPRRLRSGWALARTLASPGEAGGAPLCARLAPHPAVCPIQAYYFDWVSGFVASVPVRFQRWVWGTLHASHTEAALSPPPRCRRGEREKQPSAVRPRWGRPSGAENEGASRRT
ncbi:MAG: hypothetical protein HYW10_07305 [Candidatus Omnitrophica bacterium]|nr:hypothetical protein [Candidatus Omnitrophota bacterium]